MKWVLLGIIVVISGCSSQRVMKDCEPLGQGFFQCEEP